MEYGIQMYSVRDLAEKDLPAAVAKMAQLGYRSVEFAGFFGHTAQQVKAMLAENHIAVSGTHSPFDPLVTDYEETVAFHKTIGNRYYIIPGYDLSSQEKLDVFIEKVNVLLPKLAQEGITLAYHNHSREFIPNADGSVIYEQLLYRTQLLFEVDTYWAFVGMKDPIALLHRIEDRVLCLHVKDGTPDGYGYPLGMGQAPVKAVWELAREKGWYMVVESETCQPDGPTEAEICIRYLQGLESA